MWPFNTLVNAYKIGNHQFDLYKRGGKYTYIRYYKNRAIEKRLFDCRIEAKAHFSTEVMFRDTDS